MQPVIVPRRIRLGLVLTLLIAATPRGALAQAPSPVDGPWSGQMQCVLKAVGPDYQDEQTHTWRMTGAPPKVGQVFREWPAVWSVQGSGGRLTPGIVSQRARDQLGVVPDGWRTSVPETSAPLTIWEVSPGRLRIASRHGVIDANGAITGKSAGTQINAPLQEWVFPSTDDAATATTVSGTSTETSQYRRGWRQPQDVPTTVTCTWNFTRASGNAAAPPLSGPISRVPTPKSSQPGIPATSVPTSGNYLVTVTGLISAQATENDLPVNFDGKGDEIYAAAVVRHYDRTSAKILESTSLQTEVYGDTNQAPNRQFAGTMSPLGGIQRGDKIPRDMSVTRVAAPQASIFPWRLWQGTLTNGVDALVISPSVWEWDNGPRVLAQWVESQNSLNGNLLVRRKILDQINAAQFGVLNLDPIQSAPGAVSVADLVGGAVAASLGIPLFSTGTQIFDGAFDRPFGLIPNGINSMAVANPVVVLTREIIESALNNGSFAKTIPVPNTNVILIVPKPGVMVIGFTDGNLFSNGTLSEVAGSYYLVLQVERLSEAASAPGGETSRTSPASPPPEQTADARPPQVTTTSPSPRPPIATTGILNPALLPPVTTNPAVANVPAQETVTPVAITPSVANVPAQETVTPVASTPSVANVPAQETVTTPNDQPPATLDANAAATPVAPCTVAGPQLGYDATPGSVHLMWPRDPINLNASSGYGTFPNAEYKVLRDDSGGKVVKNAWATDPPVRSYNVLNPILPVGVTHVTLLDVRKTYTYTVHARKYTRVVTAQSTTTTENGCWVSRVTVTPPRPQTPVLAKFSFDQRLRSAVISVKMVPKQGETGFLVLGPGLPAEGKEIKIYPPETGAVATISDPPAGSQTWVVAAYWNTPEGRAIDILGSGLRVTETIPPPPPRPPPPKTGPPGPPPTGINVKAFPTSDPFRDLCDVSFVVTWAPVPGATGYTVYSDDGGSGLIPFTTFTFRSSIPWRNADLARGAVDANYRNKPEFTSTMNVKVASSFPDKPDGMSAAVPLTFSTYPCMNPRNPPK